MQRRYFSAAGSEAWRRGQVPHYVTSNPRMASTYGRVIIGYLRDLLAVGRIDTAQPVYIVEVGAGSGRLAYHFLRRWLTDVRALPFENPRFVYIMSDAAAENVEFLWEHPYLRPFIDAGVLDAAVFDPLNDGEIVTFHRGSLRSDAVVNPLIYIANYFFDGLPADAFRFDRRGEAPGMFESRLSLFSDREEEDREDPEILQRCHLRYEHHALQDTVYYNEPVRDALLQNYAEHLEDSHLLFPSASLDALDRLRELSPRGALLLSADKGYHDERQLDYRPEPGVTVHGSISLMVNYHALGAYVRHGSGRVFFPERMKSGLSLGAFVLPGGDESLTYRETMFAFAEAVERGGPDDWFSVKKVVEKHYDAFDLPRLLAYLRMSEFDANVCFGCREVLRSLLVDSYENGDLALVFEAHEVLHRVLENFLPLGGERNDLFFMLGSLFYETGAPEDARVCFQESLEWHEEDAGTFYNLALCAWALGQSDAARKLVDRALELDGEFAEATELRERLG